MNTLLIYYDKPLLYASAFSTKYIPYKSICTHNTDKLMAVDILSVKETMRKSILTDILQMANDKYIGQGTKLKAIFSQHWAENYWIKVCKKIETMMQ